MADVNITGLKWVAAKYAELLQVNVTKTTLRKTIEENPNYPSLLSLTQTFSKFNIENVAYQIEPDKVTAIPTPFIALLSMGNVGQDFVVVTQIKEDRIYYNYNSNRAFNLSIDQFKRQFRNIIFFGEPSEESGELDFRTKRKNEYRGHLLNGLQILLSALLFGILFFEVSPGKERIIFGLIYILKLVGIVVTGLLLYREIDKNNAFIKSICTVFKRTSCDAVLNSKAAKIWGVSWAEIGFFYFSSTFIWCLFGSISGDIKFQWVVFANILVSPYIIFSIYYQLRVVKEWCILCLFVQLVLTLELVWGLMNFKWYRGNYFHKIIFHQNYIFVAGASILIPILFWKTIKPVLINAIKYPSSASEVKRLKSNPDIFRAILVRNKPITEGWDDLGIDLGNSSAMNSIVKICNPYCGPCARMHIELEHLIRENTNVKLKIIFTSNSDINDQGIKIVRHFMALNAENNSSKMQHALDDWYIGEKENIEDFRRKYPADSHDDIPDHAVAKMASWCKIADIAFTPTVFINGYELPGDYTIAQLADLF